ncbi:MAG TPA: S8 family serine peptidase [Thermoanaerobaculia bacterium]
MSTTRKFLVAVILCASSVRATETVSLDVPRGEYAKVIIRYQEAPRLGRRIAASARAHEATTNDVRNAGAKVERRFTRLISGVSATVRRADIAALRRLPGVASVHEDIRVQATLAQSVPATRADQVWQTLGTRGAGRTVAVIDTGIDWQHEAFGNGFGPGHRVIGGWDFVNGDADPDDDSGHGTHVAGIVGANGGGLTGVAPEVSLLAYKVLDQDGSGDSSAVIEALERAADPNGDGDLSDHVDVVNMSLGAPAVADDPMMDAVQNAVNAGIVVVVSSGNYGGFYSVGTPGVSPAAITVGAITRENTVAGFSSRGPTAFELLAKPEIVAPGVGIVSARHGGGTIAANGTSMAAPHVAGIAALVRAVHPQWTPAEVKSALVSTAVPLGSEVVSEGGGRVDALAAVNATVLANPSIANFGITSGLPVKWTATVTISLTNRSALSMDVNVASVAGERAGIDIVAPASVTLPPNVTKQITLRVDVDHAVLPIPVSGSLTYGGSITLQAGGATIRVPWTFVQAATVTVNWESEGNFGGILAGGSYTHRFNGSVPGPVKLFVPAGEFDVAIVSSDENGEPAVLFFGDRSGAGNPVIHASRTLAKNAVVSAIVDEQGRAIEPVPYGEGESGPSLQRKCGQHLLFNLGTDRLAENIILQYTTRRLRINDVTTVPVLLFEGCGDPETNSVYAVDRLFQPLDRDVTVTNSPSDYLSSPLRIAIPPLAAAPYATLSAGVLPRGSIGYGNFQVRSRAAGPFWEGRIYLTAPVHPTISSLAATTLTELNGPQYMEGPPVRRDGNRFSTSLGITPSPSDTSFAAGEEIAFGTGPLYPTSLTVAWNARDFFWSFHEWRGPLREYYRRPLVHDRFELFDEAGTLLRTGDDQICCNGIPLGAYTVTGRMSFVSTKGLNRSTITSTFDSRRADSIPPSLHTVRIADATLDFSVQDTVLNEIGENPFKDMPADRVSVAWRRHGAAEWTSATAVLTADDQGTDEELQHQATGLHYRVDLAPAVQARGPIDVRITFADDSGNTTEWIGESVISNGEGRRRAVRK